jgi:hypothetical protein
MHGLPDGAGDCRTRRYAADQGSNHVDDVRQMADAVAVWRAAVLDD